MSTEPSRTGDPLAPHSLSAIELQALLAAERGGVPFVAYRDAVNALIIVTLDQDEQTRTLGRREEMDISLTWDGEVSGAHAELGFLGDEVTIMDDGVSTNGTFVNGQRITGRARLRDGDRLRMGSTVLAFRSGKRSAALETVSSSDTTGALRLTDTQRRILVALCRPMRDGFSIPATNQQIADEVYLTVGAVKMQLRNLSAKFDLGDLPQNQKRARLAHYALQLGLIAERDLV